MSAIWQYFTLEKLPMHYARLYFFWCRYCCQNQAETKEHHEFTEAKQDKLD